MEIEETVVDNFIDLQYRLERYGIEKDTEVATAAAFYMSNLATGYPVKDLKTAWPFTEALPRLISAGLISEDGNRLTEKGMRVYNFLE